MDQLIKDLVHYLSEVTGLEIAANPMNGNELPYFLARQYAFYHLTVGRTRFTAAFLRQENEFKPAQFIKHMRQVGSTDENEVCVVAQALPTYVRKRLIERGISFVIPRVQMYLPSLGMELRPQPRKKKPVTIERFSPATQVVLIHWLLGRIENLITPLELSKQLGYSAMSMSRALDELEPTQFSMVTRSGRKRLIAFPENRKATWMQALPLLRNPISKTVRIIAHDLHGQDALPAGITALATQSMLSDTAYPEYAISRDAWKVMADLGTEQIPVEEPGTCLLQIWRYDPKTLEVDGLVDPFSLFLSLQNESDERIQIALEEMMERYQW